MSSDHNDPAEPERAGDTHLVKRQAPETDSTVEGPAAKRVARENQLSAISGTAGSVSVRGLRAGYGDQTVLDLDRLDVRPGEFLSVLGPSGCGKTTLLNVIAGFIQPESGHVVIDEIDVTNAPPYRRNLGLVFQNYALFPHLSVAQNIAYGLKTHKVRGAEQSSRIEEVLALVGLADYAGRRPGQLSGGQQQRVALARALAYQPSVLLLDEPLSNLDAKLRRQMQTELRQLQRRVGTTMIFVTHDQGEALTMSDRVALLNDGKVEQLGTPQEIYRDPATTFVADFLGAGNLLPVRVLDDATVLIEHAGRADNADLPAGACPTGDIALPIATGRPAGTEATIVLRREHLRPLASPGTPGAPRGVVAFRAFSGSTWQLQVRLLTEGQSSVDADGPVIAIEIPDAGAGHLPPAEGSEVWLEWDPDAVVVIDS